MKKYRITVTGLGYVGLSQAVLLSQKHSVTAVDLMAEKVELVNRGISPIQDRELEEYLASKPLDLKATTDPEEAYRDAEFVIIAVPTDYDEEKQEFDTSKIETAAETVRKYNKSAFIVIKSTVPVGYTVKLRKMMNDGRILFSPEFLRETKALYDNLYPDRIVVGTDGTDPILAAAAHTFAELLREGALKPEVPAYIMDLSEAEAVKLFSNAYLAMRVDFFNELDSYAEVNGLNTQNIIRGVCADNRIGDHYNNPSFGYGGYCLPKDTKQLLRQFTSGSAGYAVPESIMSSIVEANDVRKKFIAQRVMEKAGTGNQVIGVYRLIMKANCEDFRYSAVQGVMQELKTMGAELLIYEPNLAEDFFFDCEVIRDLSVFKERCGAILANRYDQELEDVAEKVYTRDVFRRD